MKIAIEIVRDRDGHIHDINKIETKPPLGLAPASPNSHGYTWVQTLNGQPILGAVFKSNEIIVWDTEDC